MTDVQSRRVAAAVNALLECAGTESVSGKPRTLPPMRIELRTLELWRATISECLAAFFFVFVVCGAGAAAGGGAGAGGAPANSGALLASALAAGAGAATLYQCFGQTSGAHANPAITLALATRRLISALRAAMFVVAQCGGGIAGAALLYGVAATGHPMLTSVLPTSQQPALMTPWERFGVELILSFLVVLTYCGATDSAKTVFNSQSSLAPFAIGGAYLVCSLVLSPALNPTRALGPAFVMNRWESHWVYWFGPISGGILAGLVYEFILSPRRHNRRARAMDGESSSINSDDDPYDDLDKSQLRGVPTGGPGARLPLASLGSPLSGPTSSSTYCAANGGGSSLYGAPPCKLDRVESLYGGTKSLYAKSPPLTRANLSRSQSVYAKAPGNGPLVAAQSLYPAMRLNPVSGFGSAIGGGLGLSPMPIMAPHCLANQQPPPPNQLQQHRQNQQQQQNQQNEQNQQNQQNQQQHHQQQQNQQQQQTQQQKQSNDIGNSAPLANSPTNQNQQNAARNESVYGTRNTGNSHSLYGVTTHHHHHHQQLPPPPPPPHAVPLPAPSPGGSSSATSERDRERERERERERRPESMYGVAPRRQESADSTYGSYPSSERSAPPGSNSSNGSNGSGLVRQNSFGPGHSLPQPQGGKCVVGGSGGGVPYGMRPSHGPMSHPHVVHLMPHHQNSVYGVHRGPTHSPSGQY